MYIRSSPRGPNRDPNRTLSNELLLYIKLLYYKVFLLNYLLRRCYLKIKSVSLGGVSRFLGSYVTTANTLQARRFRAILLKLLPLAHRSHILRTVGGDCLSVFERNFEPHSPTLWRTR